MAVPVGDWRARSGRLVSVALLPRPADGRAVGAGWTAVEPLSCSMGPTFLDESPRRDCPICSAGGILPQLADLSPLKCALPATMADCGRDDRGT